VFKHRKTHFIVIALHLFETMLDAVCTTSGMHNLPHSSLCDKLRLTSEEMLGEEMRETQEFSAKNVTGCDVLRHHKSYACSAAVLVLRHTIWHHPEDQRISYC